MDKPIQFHLPWIVWLGVIAFLSFLPGDKIPTVTFKLLSPSSVAHILMYAILAFLFLVGFAKKTKKMNLSEIGLYARLTLVGILIGYTAELIQGNFIYRRYFDVADILLNTVGTIFGTFTYILISRKLI